MARNIVAAIQRAVEGVTLEWLPLEEYVPDSWRHFGVTSDAVIRPDSAR